MNPGSQPLSRRRFLHLGAAGAAALASSGVTALSCDNQLDPDGWRTLEPLLDQAERAVRL